MTSAATAPTGTRRHDARRQISARLVDVARATATALSTAYARSPRLLELLLALLILVVAATVAGIGILTVADLLQVRSWAR